VPQDNVIPSWVLYGARRKTLHAAHPNALPNPHNSKPQKTTAPRGANNCSVLNFWLHLWGNAKGVLIIDEASHQGCPQIERIVRAISGPDAARKRVLPRALRPVQNFQLLDVNDAPRRSPIGRRRACHDIAQPGEGGRSLSLSSCIMKISVPSSRRNHHSQSAVTATTKTKPPTNLFRNLVFPFP
jgi:hypothetical protein